MNSTVSVKWLSPAYPPCAPFDPSELYPEYPFSGIEEATSDDANEVYPAVRRLLHDLDLDRARFGTREWNPLGELVRQGQTVLIKPNLVVSDHEHGMEGLIATIANPSVLRTLIDLAFIAVGPEGLILVGDSPIKEVDFERVCRLSGLSEMADVLRRRGVPLELCDFRDLRAFRDANNVIVDTAPLEGDPRGYAVYDLGSDSLFNQLSEAECRRLRSTAAVYEDEASKHHSPSHNYYALARSIVDADLVISVAKLKSHRKSGITAALKNAIGTTNEKRWLPHHRVGTPSQGGDICPDDAPVRRKLGESWRQWANKSRHGKLARRLLKPPMVVASRALRRYRTVGPGVADIGEGDWWGNDTIWRTTLDINVLLRYGARDGTIADEPQRAYLAVVDAILAGDGEGPLHPDPKPVGGLIGSTDPVAADVVAATIAGFDYRLIPTVARAHEAGRPLGTNDPECIALRSDGRLTPIADLPNFEFRPSSGWKHHIERIVGNLKAVHA